MRDSLVSLRHPDFLGRQIFDEPFPLSVNVKSAREENASFMAYFNYLNSFSETAGNGPASNGLAVKRKTKGGRKKKSRTFLFFTFFLKKKKKQPSGGKKPPPAWGVFISILKKK